jgi:hypothetical protein
MPSDGGLLRIGDEILAYRQLQSDTGAVTVAATGRGLLGSKPQAHDIGEPVMFLENRSRERAHERALGRRSAHPDRARSTISRRRARC